jgi:hypothetical protein
MKAIPAEEKVFMVDKRTNTTYGGSAALQAMQEWYTMEDVAYNVRPYKVFTALLTQTGDSDYQTITSGQVEKGVTYRITDDGGSGWDFTNVGAPNNDIDTYFIATDNLTPNSWGSGGMLAYDLGAPVATVLENTMGNIYMFYGSNVGEYGIAWNSPFKQERTWVTTTPAEAGSSSLISALRKTDEAIVVLTTFDGSPSDDILSYTPIEIRYYQSYE